MVKLIDSHAHLTDPSLYPDLKSILTRAKSTGVCKIINVCTDADSLKRGLAAQKKYPCLSLAAAATPHDVDAIGDQFFLEVARTARAKKLKAIGETGLDYYYRHSDRENQKRHLLKYIALAEECGLPLIFHVRDAFDDFFNLLPKDKIQGVLHCFTGNLQDAEKGLKRDLFISFSGIVTFTKSRQLQQIATQIPLEKILIETDAPYLAPQSKRGRKNEPAFVLETAQKIAELKNIPLEKLAEITAANAACLFKL